MSVCRCGCPSLPERRARPLCRGGKENESESWAPIQEWILSLRRRGISVLFVHHAGKGGAQRGTSKREDVLDTVIVLRHPDNYSPSDGARFEVHLDKARGVYGEQAQPLKPN
jgi:putative DNA primase/helicase